MSYFTDLIKQSADAKRELQEQRKREKQEHAAQVAAAKPKMDRLYATMGEELKAAAVTINSSGLWEAEFDAELRDASAKSMTLFVNKKAVRFLYESPADQMPKLTVDYPGVPDSRSASVEGIDDFHNATEVFLKSILV